MSEPYSYSVEGCVVREGYPGLPIDFHPIVFVGVDEGQAEAVARALNEYRLEDDE